MSVIPPILRTRYGALALLLSFLCLVYFISISIPRGAVAYSLRPLWDRTEAPSMPITHYYSGKLSKQELCQLHGWDERKDEKKRQVWDAVSSIYSFSSVRNYTTDNRREPVDHLLDRNRPPPRPITRIRSNSRQILHPRL